MDVEYRKQVLYLRMHNVSPVKGRNVSSDQMAILGSFVRGVAGVRLRTRRAGE